MNLFRIFSIICMLMLGFMPKAQRTEFFKIKKYKLAELSKTIKETSGLAKDKGKLLTINDSGNPPVVYALDPKNGSITDSVKIDASNFDWEAIAVHDGKWYVGDFGNNMGTRRDLHILEIELATGKVLRKIGFYFPEQKDFSQKNHQHDFDVEAMFFAQGKLHLLSKSWLTNICRHYTLDLSDTTAAIPAQMLEETKLPYIVTDASFYQDKVYTVGYTKSTEVYLTEFSMNTEGKIFSGFSTYYLGMATGIGQIEGIAATEEGIYISGEKFKMKPFKVPQSLYFIPWKDFPTTQKSAE